MIALLYLSSLGHFVFAHPDHAAYDQTMKSDVLKWYIPRVLTAPTIDGYLMDSCWSGIKGIRGFTKVEKQGGGTSVRSTTVYGVYDADAIYFVFECIEPQISRRVARFRAKDSRVFMDDCIEVYLDTSHDHNNYYQFVVNTLNGQYDATGPFPNCVWDGKWESAVAIFKDRYIIELSIPFSTLKTETPKPYEVWGGNVFRQVWIPGAEEWSGWSPTRRYFHEPGYFGHLIFAPEPIP
ncbi:MAG: hypothetical protein B6244_09490 [Candidatus Cloacimonetes bacterium 4572_55]|nr:MAG: hypothetical protein B6244_09490 [Candidatus Cloacimonetes bacterium 4572_55]